MLEPLDTPNCPLCGQPNGCAAVAAGSFDVACWCASETFPAGLLERVPHPMRGRACICRACVEQARRGRSVDPGAPGLPLGAHRAVSPLREVRAVCFDWGGTLMSEDGPPDVPMALWPVVRSIEGADACLRALEGRLPLAIATNAGVSGRQMIEAALERVGLRRYFGHVFCFAEIGLRKSHPGFWDVVTQTLGLPAQRIAMVGDGWEEDALRPRQFGIQAAWFDPAGEADRFRQGVPVVRRLSTFSEWVLDAGGGTPA